MDFELKNFEDKINDITEQFMSLLDSNYVIDDSITAKFDTTTSNDFSNDVFEETNATASTFNPINTNDVKVGGMAFTNTEPVNGISFAESIQQAEPVSFDTITKPVEGITFEKAPLSSGVTFGNINLSSNTIPYEKVNLEGATSNIGTEPNIGSASFSSFDQTDLDRRLEELYQSTKSINDEFVAEHPIMFSDSNIGGYVEKDRPKLNEVSEKKFEGYNANDKEGYTMANYNGEDSLFSFATVPEDRALTTTRSFADVLFMDIPWDTKIDIWGGFKSLFTTDIRITF